VAALQLGSFVRHKMFSVCDHEVGSSLAVAVLPFAFGPRHCGQLAAVIDAIPKLMTSPQTRLFRI
ncbi:MAG: hypothetical protein WCI73_06340, partial [Phycisphaerae bacterium]